MDPNLPQGWFGPPDHEFYVRTLNNLPDEAIFAEVGSWKGRSLCSVADIIKNKNLKVIAVDTWKGSSTEVHPEGACYEATQIDMFEVFMENIEKFGIDKYVTPFQMPSVKASSRFPNEYFDFIFIDADHVYKHVIEDMKSWYPKLKTGGMFAGHDWRNNNGVVKAVDEFYGGRNYDVDAIIWWKVKEL